jgi:catechol 2,3-dioxygenase-like lactoylglutathione lyase family enzyme
MASVTIPAARSCLAEIAAMFTELPAIKSYRPVRFTKKALHPVPGSADLCLITRPSPEAVGAHLRGCGVAIELGPVTKTGALGTMRSVYCRDPDGNPVEVATYEDRPG